MTSNHIKALTKTGAAPFDAYARYVESAWHGLLNGKRSPSEKQVQHFIEQHPCLLGGGFGHHGTFLNAVITQPILYGFETYIPDFLIITSNSSTIYVDFYELESPSKQWFTKKGQPTAKLTQAITQIRDWKRWLKKSENRIAFSRKYMLRKHFGKLPIEARYILLYGRSSEANINERTIELRSEMTTNGEHIMTYDRLYPDYELANCVTVVARTDGFHVTSFPPTFRISEQNAYYMSLLKNKQSALLESPLLSNIRKHLLAQRLNHWDEWAKKRENRRPREIDHFFYSYNWE